MQHENICECGIAANVAMGENVVLGRNITIGEGCVLGHNVVIHDDTVIGARVRIDDNTVIGKLPMRSVNSAVTQIVELEPCRIGDDCIIGTLSVIYRGAQVGRKVLIADQASVREMTSIGEMTIVGRGVVIENKVKIGRRSKIETNAYITALSEIGDGCFIAPEVSFSNDPFLGRTRERFAHHKGVTLLNGARIGVNATILPGIELGEDCLVGAGSVVTRNVSRRSIVFGAPARHRGIVPDNQLLENQ